MAVRRVVEKMEAAKTRLMELVREESGGDILEERRWSKDGGRGV